MTVSPRYRDYADVHDSGLHIPVRLMQEGNPPGLAYPATQSPHLQPRRTHVIDPEFDSKHSSRIVTKTTTATSSSNGRSSSKASSCSTSSSINSRHRLVRQYAMPLRCRATCDASIPQDAGFTSQASQPLLTSTPGTTSATTTKRDRSIRYLPVHKQQCSHTLPTAPPGTPSTLADGLGEAGVPASGDLSSLSTSRTHPLPHTPPTCQSLATQGRQHPAAVYPILTSGVCVAGGLMPCPCASLGPSTTCRCRPGQFRFVRTLSCRALTQVSSRIKLWKSTSLFAVVRQGMHRSSRSSSSDILSKNGMSSESHQVTPAPGGSVAGPLPHPSSTASPPAWNEGSPFVRLFVADMPPSPAQPAAASSTCSCSSSFRSLPTGSLTHVFVDHPLFSGSLAGHITPSSSGSSSGSSISGGPIYTYCDSSSANNLQARNTVFCQAALAAPAMLWSSHAQSSSHAESACNDAHASPTTLPSTGQSHAHPSTRLGTPEPAPEHAPEWHENIPSPWLLHNGIASRAGAAAGFRPWKERMPPLKTAGTSHPPTSDTVLSSPTGSTVPCRMPVTAPRTVEPDLIPAAAAEPPVGAVGSPPVVFVINDWPAALLPLWLRSYLPQTIPPIPPSPTPASTPAPAQHDSNDVEKVAASITAAASTIAAESITAAASSAESLAELSAFQRSVAHQLHGSKVLLALHNASYQVRISFIGVDSLLLWVVGQLVTWHGFAYTCTCDPTAIKHKPILVCLFVKLGQRIFATGHCSSATLSTPRDVTSRCDRPSSGEDYLQKYGSSLMVICVKKT